MCEYCEKEKIILEQENNVHLSAWHWGWAGIDYAITMDKAQEDTYTLSMFIDRGYVRLVDREDCGCLDHGLKAKIKYCPFCGMKLNEYG